MHGIKECIIEWGSTGNLMGLLTEPLQVQEEKPVILLLNAGLVHHVGPFRMNTDFARALGQAGFTCFRFDLSGIGDSAAAPDSSNAEQRFLVDSSSAMDCLQERLGAERQFIVFGLCTGADNAHKIAARDPRICGAIFLDGYCYPSPRFHRNRYGSFLSSPRRMLGWAGRTLKSMGTADDGTQIVDGIFTWQLPSKEQACADWTHMLATGMQLLFVYSHGALNLCNYENQLLDAVPVMRQHISQIQVKRFPLADHTYALSSDRTALLNLIKEWLQRF